jgi:hypothetical protein
MPGAVSGYRRQVAAAGPCPARLGRALALAPGHRGEARGWLEHALEQGDGGAEVAGNAGIGLTDAGLPGLGERHLAAAAALTASEPFLHALYVARQAKTAMRAEPSWWPPDGGAGRSQRRWCNPPADIHLRHVYDGRGGGGAISEVRRPGRTA